MVWTRVHGLPLLQLVYKLDCGCHNLALVSDDDDDVLVHICSPNSPQPVVATEASKPSSLDNGVGGAGVAAEDAGHSWYRGFQLPVILQDISLGYGRVSLDLKQRKRMMAS